MRKQLYHKGDRVIVDGDNVIVTILEAYPCEMSALSRRPDGWEYKVRWEGKPKPYYLVETEIAAKVTFDPISFNAARHHELADALVDYGVVREWLETLPLKKKIDKRNMNIVKQVLEQCALLYEGTMEDDPENEIEQLLR
jgi:hypothetical protein